MSTLFCKNSRMAATPVAPCCTSCRRLVFHSAACSAVGELDWSSRVKLATNARLWTVGSGKVVVAREGGGRGTRGDAEAGIEFEGRGLTVEIPGTGSRVASGGAAV